MKKVLVFKIFGLIALFCCTYSSIAQQSNGGIIPVPIGGSPKGYPFTITDSSQMSLTEYRDLMFGALDLSSSQIPTGRLMEYSLLGWDITKFTRTSADSIKSPNQWFQLYHRLYKSQVNGSSQLLSADSVRNLVADLGFGGDTLPVMVLDKAYQTIRQSSLNEGCFTMSADGNSLYDVPNRAINPYNSERLFAVSLYKTEFMAKRINFSFPQSLWIADTQSIKVDLADGQGWRTATPNTIFSTYYQTIGDKYIKIAKSASGTGTSLCFFRNYELFCFNQPF